MLFKRSYFLLSLLLFCSCATHHPLQPKQPDDKASVMLAEAANSVSRSLVELARIEKSVLPRGKKLIDPTPLNLSGTVSVSWSGPIEPLLKRLSDQMHFQLRTLGTKPEVPLLVTVSVHNAPLGSMLRDLDFQAGHRAEIVVFPKTKIVELRYARI